MDGINYVISYLQANPLLGIAVLLMVALLIYKEPKFFVTVFLFASVIVAALYLILYLSETGTAHKETLINKSRP